MYLKDTTEKGGRSVSSELYGKPDVSCFNDGDVPPKVDDDDNPLLERLFQLLQMLFEFKRSTEDPNTDPDGSADRATLDFQHWASKANHARGQTVSYALSMFESTPRVFCFSVVVIGKFARFVRWDRAGAIASERFDWTSSGLMEEFLWRFSHMSRAQRGFDTSVVPPSPAEVKMVKRVFQKAKSDRRDIPYPTEGETFSKFYIWDKDGKQHAVIAGLPQTRPWSMTGRSTFGYVGVDVETEAIVFLKDTWRIAVPGMPREGDIYTRLQDNDVPHLPDYRYGGDVPVMCPLPSPAPHTIRPDPPPGPHGDHCKSCSPDPEVVAEWEIPPTDPFAVQRTVTQDSAKCTWACETAHLAEHVHYRIVLGKVGRKLKTFRFTKQFCQALFDALICHTAAYKLGVLHRDLSAGNIMIDEDGRGMLIDWDLCMEVLLQAARRFWRTGTWQFISADLLRKPFSRVHLLRDDLESLVHVLFHHMLRYRPAGFLTVELATNLQAVFDAHTVVNGQARGGDQKAFYLSGGGYFGPSTLINSTLHRPLVALMNALRELFFYIYTDEELLRRFPASMVE
ncbi:hypothetical protein OF83DRAFT_193659, partial [Amylostereum chailletii]